MWTILIDSEVHRHQGHGRDELHHHHQGMAIIMAVILQINANDVLHEAVKIMVGYLWHILAVLFRSGYKQAQRLESSRGKRATCF